jgi:transcriptional regulator with XRE-family HTH domain
MTSPGPDHKLAQALDLARREAALTTAQLAKALSFNPRTVRRYLNAERRPERDTVVRWEQVCKTTPGTLTALYDGSPTSDTPPPSPSRTPTRSLLRSAVAVVTVFVALGAVLLLRNGNEPDLGHAAQERPTGVAYHRFTPSFVGDVWMRITPARQHTGELHRVTLRWGPIMQHVDLKNLDGSQALFTAKTKPDNVTMRVNVKPAATIVFGERNVPAGARDINHGWKNAD